MTATINLSNELRTRLEQQAHLRGATIAQTVEQLVADAEAKRLAAFFAELRAQGGLLPKKSAPAGRSYKRIDVAGKPVSECLVEERR